MDKTQIPTVLKSHFLRLYQIALADDDFSALELKMLYGFAEERGILREHLDEILLNPVDANNLIPEQVNEKLAFLYDFTAMIWADEIVTNDGFSTETGEEQTTSRYRSATVLLTYVRAVKSNKTKQEIINALND